MFFLRTFFLRAKKGFIEATMLAANLERVVVGSSANRVEKGILDYKKNMHKGVETGNFYGQFIDTECMSTH